MTGNRELSDNGKIEQRIYVLRGQRVMVSTDLAALYGVKPGTLMQAVKRNLQRFPDDFMFQLTMTDAKSSRSQIVILKRGGNLKYPPYAFTEQGVAMLSSVLRSARAVRVNIAIMRAFVRLRELLSTNRELSGKLMDLEVRMGTNETSIMALLAADQFSRKAGKSARRKPIG